MKLSLEGADELARDLMALGDKAPQAAKDVVGAGADILKDRMKDTAIAKGHVDTGAMAASIGYKGVNTSTTGAWAEVYPLGRDGRRTNAEKAFILHYGSSKIRGDHWMDDAVEAAGGPALDAMQRKLEEAIG